MAIRLKIDILVIAPPPKKKKKERSRHPPGDVVVRGADEGEDVLDGVLFQDAHAGVVAGHGGEILVGPRPLAVKRLQVHVPLQVLPQTLLRQRGGKTCSIQIPLS